MFDEILEKFAEKSPVTVMVQGLLERLLDAKKLDEWFESIRERQYTKTILFSSIVAVMIEVVCRVRSSVLLAFINSNIETSKVAFYGKLQGLEANTSRELVRYIAQESEKLIEELNGKNPEVLPGYRTKYVDGNCIEASDHRLKVLRGTSSGALPGKSLVVFEAELGIVTDVIPCEDGHAQERSLLSDILDTVEKNDLWVADRNFCVVEFLSRIASSDGFFNIREHKNIPWEPLLNMKFVGETETGKVYEQQVNLSVANKISKNNNNLKIRRIMVKLNKPTRNGESEIALLTNLPFKDADALKVAEIYRLRWTIEIAFQKLEKHLNSEINTLAYPKAALFGFCMALVAFNIYAVVMAALRTARPDKDINEEISEYYIAQEISSTYNGMLIAVPEQQWNIFKQASTEEMAALLLELALQIDLLKFKKHKRRTKKISPKKTKYHGKPHVSTARLIAGNA